MFMQSIVSACVSSHHFPFGTYIERLIEIAKRPIVTSSDTETDLPQVCIGSVTCLHKDRINLDTGGLWSVVGWPCVWRACLSFSSG